MNRSGSFWWIDGELSGKERTRLEKMGITVVPDGSVVFVTRGTGKFKGQLGHGVRLNGNGSISDLGPPRVAEIEFYGGDGERFFRAYLEFAGWNVVFAFAGSVGAGAKIVGLIRKAVDLPGWKNISIDMVHIASSHMEGGLRLAQSLANGGAKSVFPSGMSETEVDRVIRWAYRYGEKISTQGERVVVRGESNGLKIEMYVNKTTKIIETAYPVND